MEGGDSAGLEADKANNLIDKDNIATGQADFVQLAAGERVDQRRRARELTRILGNLRQTTVALSRGVRAGKRRQASGVVITQALYAINLGDGQRRT